MSSMQFDNRRSVTTEIRRLLKRDKDDEKQLVDALADLIQQAFEAGEEEGKRREHRRGGIG
jgi:hypothetical protein